jgi:toxin ParE1/3/4
MAKVNWTEHAVDRLDQIHDYIAEDKPSAASSLIEQLIDQTEKLDRFPQSGRVVPEFSDPTIREILFNEYRIVYKIRNDGNIDVLSVHESRRLLSNQDLG